MYAYIARQPIFNINKKIRAYELLYRDGTSGNTARFSDGDSATCRLLSDAITLFGLPMLTNKQTAYVNFTQNLILNDFVRLANPKDIVVELLEDIIVNDVMLEKLKTLKDLGYTLALDDYTGQEQFNDLLPLIDIIKVDFALVGEEKRRQFARAFKNTPITLLAEKVETTHDFSSAADMGYTLFQGYFFEKPKIFSKKILSLAGSSSVRILNELQKREVDFDACAKIMHSDAVMTYMLMQKIHSLSYYRGNLVSGIKHALVMMGITELRKWVILLLARESNITQSDELVRAAFLRGTFIENLMLQSEHWRMSEQGFILGMFSLLDKILGIRMEDLLRDVYLDSRVEDALMGRSENIFSLALQYAIVYEMANPSLMLPNIGLRIGMEEVAQLYMQCIVKTDETFNSFGGSYNP